MSALPGQQLTLVDCTLRDGGYCNNWQFDRKMAYCLVRDLSRSGLNIIEVGYKAPPIHRPNGFEGLFRYCTESQLSFLRHFSCDYAFMIDAKEYIEHGRASPSLVRACTVPARESPFSWVRIATVYDHLQVALDLVPIFRELGYRVTINLMQLALLSEQLAKEAFERCARSPIDASTSLIRLAP